MYNVSEYVTSPFMGSVVFFFKEFYKRVVKMCPRLSPRVKMKRKWEKNFCSRRTKEDVLSSFVFFSVFSLVIFSFLHGWLSTEQEYTVLLAFLHLFHIAAYTLPYNIFGLKILSFVLLIKSYLLITCDLNWVESAFLSYVPKIFNLFIFPLCNFHLNNSSRLTSY